MTFSGHGQIKTRYHLLRVLTHASFGGGLLLGSRLSCPCSGTTFRFLPQGSHLPPFFCAGRGERTPSRHCDLGCVHIVARVWQPVKPFFPNSDSGHCPGMQEKRRKRRHTAFQWRPGLTWGRVVFVSLYDCGRAGHGGHVTILFSLFRSCGGSVRRRGRISRRCRGHNCVRRVSRVPRGKSGCRQP